ncbi:hypothetical protein FOZ62_014206, partial [Perkinsus olseni]
EKTKASVQVYIDSWRSKQAELRERSIKETPQDYRLSLYDLVCTTEVANSIGGYQNSNWRGPLTVVRLAGTSMVYLFDGTERLPNDRTTMAVTYKLKLVPLMENLVYDHLEKGVRVYQDAIGSLSTVPDNADGSDRSKVLLRQAQDKVLKFLLLRSFIPVGWLSLPMASLIEGWQ